MMFDHSVKKKKDFYNHHDKSTDLTEAPQLLMINKDLILYTAFQWAPLIRFIHTCSVL